MTAGLAFEAMNHAGTVKDLDLLVILNDNRMSISNSVGALSLYLQRIRKKPFWMPPRARATPPADY